MTSHISWTGNILKKNDVKKAIEVNYYDMFYRRVESPTGLTLVVTRYNDGSISTEKKLFLP